MLGLKLPTDPRWVDVVEKNIENILTDHVYCEQKAASYAISLITKYPEITELVDKMTDLAQEELGHLKMVHQKIKDRGLVLGWEHRDPYVHDLLKFIKKGGDYEMVLVERLLIAAMIEARSCERFRMLSEQLKDKDLANKLTEDIDEMGKMLNEYLQFTSSSYIEKDELFNLSELIEEIIKKYNNENITKTIPSRIYFNGRRNLIKRCINNLIDNSIKYSNRVNIEFSKKNTNLFIKIEDNGPGIPEQEYDNVFKPFYKIDKGRTDSKSSVGLGLSIASDIIQSHGGNIKLEKSSMNGLGVKIFLPV